MNIRRICLKLDWDTIKYIIQALVISKLDYCNSLLLRLANYQLNKIQWIKYMACRIVCNLQKLDHVTPSMQDLHWLKIPYWIQFKIACIMFKCINGQTPKYLTDLLPSKQKTWQQCSLASNIHPSILHRSSLAYNALFPAAGPRLWNSLPENYKTATISRYV